MANRELPVVDMTDGGSFDDAVSVAMQERFAMPMVVVAALRQAGKKVTLRLLELVEDDNAFDALTPTEKMKLAELLLDRAYGKSETASNSIRTAQLTGQGSLNSDHGRQLDEIEARMEERSINYPELRKAARLREIAQDASSAELHKGDATRSVMDRMQERVVRFDSSRGKSA